ncbi:NADP-specific glutamate dehydrogenase [Acinetobacter rudis]|uniref:NADP-specific glutamate dehydrogenase n=1 Tax=Acinetobacter rudis TaxID=632955 RepID=UPI003342A906
MSGNILSHSAEDKALKYTSLNDFLNYVKARDPNQPEFLQAVEEVMTSLWPFIEKNPQYAKYGLLERLVEPERAIQFRVSWLDDQGNTQVNRAFRIQYNSAIGPFKGGMRFHPSVNLSILKFLGFEQTFKNALTTLPMGGGKGGSDFNPKGKSEGEIMRFCQALMVELYRHLGANTDIPAGDIGVGGREVGYMAGMMKKLSNDTACVFTGKGMSFGGSLARPEATGFGTVYFAEEMLKTRGETFKDKVVAISGSGNVAQFAAEKAMFLGAKVVSLSDSNGTVYMKDGLTDALLLEVMELKNIQRGRISEFAAKHGFEYLDGQRPWGIQCDIALPCATQNELDGDDAEKLLANGTMCVAEGANMPSTLAAVEKFIEAKILYAPGKASNAGGVATSGLEMSQNAIRLGWTFEEVDERLHAIMKEIHRNCVKFGTQEDGTINYVDGANIAGFVKVADAMLAQGVF